MPVSLSYALHAVFVMYCFSDFTEIGKKKRWGKNGGNAIRWDECEIDLQKSDKIISNVIQS